MISDEPRKLHWRPPLKLAADDRSPLAPGPPISERSLARSLANANVLLVERGLSQVAWFLSDKLALRTAIPRSLTNGAAEGAAIAFSDLLPSAAHQTKSELVLAHSFAPEARLTARLGGFEPATDQSNIDRLESLERAGQFIRAARTLLCHFEQRDASTLEKQAG